MKFSITGGSMNERSFVVFDNARAFCLLFLFCCRVYYYCASNKKTTIRSRTFPFVIDDPTHSTRRTCFYRPPFIASQIENLGVKLQKSNQLINLNTYCTSFEPCCPDNHYFHKILSIGKYLISYEIDL